MKITTQSPVYINKKTVSYPDEYIAFDGSNTNDIKAFQDWLDINHPGWVKGKSLNQGPGYGTYGPSTKAAQAQYLSEYETKTAQPVVTNTVEKVSKNKGELLNKAKDVVKSTGLLDTAKGWINDKLGIKSDSAQSGPGMPDVQATSSSAPEKKGMNKTLKISLIVAGSALLIYAGYKIFTKKK
jgi:hypothetical protein